MGTLAAGIKDIFSTAKTTGTNVMLSANDGTPDGHISMVDLASIIGGVRPLGIKTRQEDIDSTAQGCFSVHSANIFNNTNSEYGIVIAFKANTNNNYMIQYYLSYDLQKFGARIKWNNDTWSEWALL